MPQKGSFLTLFFKFLAAAFWENYSEQKIPVLTNRIESVFSFVKCFGTKFRNVASIFVPRNGILSCFHFCEMVQWNSEHFFHLQKGLERNTESFLFRGTNHLFRLFRLLRNYFFVVNSQPYLRSFGSKCLKDVTNEIFIDKFSYFAQWWLDFLW